MREPRRRRATRQRRTTTTRRISDLPCRAVSAARRASTPAASRCGRGRRRRPARPSRACPPRATRTPRGRRVDGIEPRHRPVRQPSREHRRGERLRARVVARDRPARRRRSHGPGDRARRASARSRTGSRPPTARAAGARSRPAPCTLHRTERPRRRSARHAIDAPLGHRVVVRVLRARDERFAVLRREEEAFALLPERLDHAVDERTSERHARGSPVTS